MSFTRTKAAGVNTNSTVKAAMRARTASSAAAANAANAAQQAALAAQNAAGVAATAAGSAAQSASGAAQTAVAGMSKGVRQGVYSARSWAAPRLDNAADYCTTTVAPRVSAALHSTARQVSPPPTKASKRSSILTWSLLGAAVLTAVGAGAAVARYRYRAAIAADTEAADEEVLADSTGSAPASTDEGRPVTAENSKSQEAETSVNGRVPTSGW